MKNKFTKTLIRVNNCLEGETIETRVMKIMNSKEAISDTAPRIFTERKEGVMPDYNIRTDKWDIAIESMDKVSKLKLLARADRKKEPTPSPDPTQSPASIPEPAA